MGRAAAEVVVYLPTKSFSYKLIDALAAALLCMVLLLLCCAATNVNARVHSSYRQDMGAAEILMY